MRCQDNHASDGLTCLISRSRKGNSSQVDIRAANLFLSLNAPRTLAAAPADQDQGDISSLTRRLASGDEEAFRRFHALYFDRLYRFLLVVSRGQEHEARE